MEGHGIDGGGAGRTRRLLVLGVAQRSAKDDPEVAAYYAELERLAESAGAEVVETRIQVRSRLDPKTYVGPGFAQMAIDAVAASRQALSEGEGEDGDEGDVGEDADEGDGADQGDASDEGDDADEDLEGGFKDESVRAPIDGILLAEEVTPRVLSTLSARFPVPVEDRTQLILGIFAERARSAEGRLQVELAQLSYRLPRLAGRRQGLSRQGGGIGMRGGSGETALELDRRRVRQRIAQLKRDVAELRAERDTRREGRGDILRIALVGYTNAGKTTLLGALAGRDEGGRDRLFDTLDPTTRRIHHAAFGDALLTDTVGLVRDLPPGLIEAFEATLAEVREADILLHVVDASSPTAAAEAEAVRTVLERIEADRLPEVLVATHSASPLAQLDRLPGAVAVDAPSGLGLGTLCERIGEMLGRLRTSVTLDVPADRWDVVSFARSRGQVELEPHDDGSVRLVARLKAEDAARLRHRLEHGSHV